MAEIFDPHVIARIKGFDLRSKRLVEGMLEGSHKSALRGMSTSFAQHRQYVPGDDLRHLDWKVFSRTDRFYIKQYEAETNLACNFLLDSSMSMFFASESAAMSKFEYAATMAAALAYLLMKQKDAFGLALFDDDLRTLLPAKSSGSHFRLIINALQEAEPGGQTDFSGVTLKVGPRLKRKGVVVLISDFLADLDEFALALGQLHFNGQDVLIMHIEDPAERDFDFHGQTIFREPESEGRMLCDPADLRERYMAERDRHHAELVDCARRFGYGVERLCTDTPLDEALAGFLASRLLNVGG